jgi:hypothetical protein
LVSQKTGLGDATVIPAMSDSDDQVSDPQILRRLLEDAMQEWRNRLLASTAQPTISRLEQVRMGNEQTRTSIQQQSLNAQRLIQQQQQQQQVLLAPINDLAVLGDKVSEIMQRLNYLEQITAELEDYCDGIQ